MLDNKPVGRREGVYKMINSFKDVVYLVKDRCVPLGFPFSLPPHPFRYEPTLICNVICFCHALRVSVLYAFDLNLFLAKLDQLYVFVSVA